MAARREWTGWTADPPGLSGAGHSRQPRRPTKIPLWSPSPNSASVYSSDFGSDPDFDRDPACPDRDSARMPSEIRDRPATKCPGRDRSRVSGPHAAEITAIQSQIDDDVEPHLYLTATRSRCLSAPWVCPVECPVLPVMDGRFEWDPEKAEENRRKHGVSFEEASTAFGDPLAIVLEDIVHSRREDRYLLMGRSGAGRVLVAVHAERGRAIRLISARPATRREKRAYEEGE